MDGRPKSTPACRRIEGLALLLVAASLLAAMAACSSTTTSAPVDDSLMVEILMELHLAAARAETTNEIPPNISDSILASYGVDSTAYAESVTYYSKHPQEYAELYGLVLDGLNSERMPLGYTSGAREDEDVEGEEEEEDDAVRPMSP